MMKYGSGGGVRRGDADNTSALPRIPAKPGGVAATGDTDNTSALQCIPSKPETKKSGWQSVGRVVTGAIHLRNEKPCQDALFLQEHKHCTIACVADGHGSDSCPYSDEGAAAAVQIAGEILAEMLPDIQAHKDIRLPKQLETKWKERVKEIHAEKEREPAEPFPYILYGTTLLAVAVAEKFIFALQIGDGNILMVDDESARPVLAVGESIGEDTESLCLDDAWTYIRTQIIPWNPATPAMFLLATDGYANSFADSSGFAKAGTDFFKLWQEEGLEYIKENLPGWLRQSSDKGSGDDIAMALIATDRTPQTFEKA